MLDDLKLIHERDAQDALGIAEKQGQQLIYNFLPDPKITLDHVYNIVYTGMGGSALAAMFVHTWPLIKEPFEIVRDYQLPEYVDKDTLVIVSSYSGNTEETLSSLADAESRGANIVVISSGGKLSEIAQHKGYPLYCIPKDYQPRYAVLYCFKALVDLLSKVNLVGTDDRSGSLKQASDFIDNAVKSWRPDVITSQNYAKQLALDIVGKSVVIYAGPKLYPAAYKWKISFNENAKNIAWCNQYPEFNHNEFLGWTSQPLEKPYAVVDLRSKLESQQVQKRFEISERLLSGRRPAPLVVEAEGQTILEQMLWVVALGDFVSIYTAILNGLNPSPVDLIEKFKKQLV